MKTIQFFLVASLLIISSASETLAQSSFDPGRFGDSFLKDTNGDGVINILAFGDSITRGVGDFTAAGADSNITFPSNGQEAGYPLRVEGYFGLNLINRGFPGERVTQGGVARFARTIPGADVVIIGGGSNDAGDQVPTPTVRRTFQTLVNIARAAGVTPILSTPPLTCCQHNGHRSILPSYNSTIKELAVINGLSVVDFDRAYRNTCNDINRCSLLNLPEGLHPNIEGYDVMGETVAATLLNIDLFSPDGPKQLTDALGLIEGSVKTKPDPVVQ